MATTQEFYRLRARNPRYTTKLATFANGMYLTDQVIPEGYAKIMVNYDIDDTGSHIKPRYGRQPLQKIDYTTDEIGAVTLTDYVYAYDSTGETAILPQDLVLSYGSYANIGDLTGIDDHSDKNMFVLKMDTIEDTGVYYQDSNYRWQTSVRGEITNKPFYPGWALRYDKNTDSFVRVNNSNVGAVTARIISNAYAFDKKVKTDIRRPVAAVLNNELIAFSTPTITFHNYINTPVRNELSGQSIPVISKLKLQNTDEELELVRAQVTPREINASEAVAGGFNLLSESPYIFTDNGYGSLMITGLLPYDEYDKDTPKITIRPNEPISVRAFYTYKPGTQLKYRVTWFDLDKSNPEENVLKDWGTDTITAGEPLYYDYTPSVIRSTIRIELRVGDDETTTVSGVLGIACDATSYEVEPKEFKLNTAKGTVVWHSCLGLYGVEGAPDTIIFSSPEDPGYFPYPYNILTFNNEILAVHNYLDMLIVVTVDSLWLVTMGDSIMTSTQKRVLDNIYIPEIDAVNLVVLKDQIFFKTDTQFYVLKPNNYRSDATDLKNYINSTAIANFTKNFTNEVVKLLNEIYRKTWQRLTVEYRQHVRFYDFDVLDITSYVRDEEVHYVYTIIPKLLTEDTKQEIVFDSVDLHLIYNTLTRAWRLYLVCIGNEHVRYKPVLYRNKQSGAWYEFIAAHNEDNKGSTVYISKQSYDCVSDNLIAGSWHLTEEYDNYQYLDSGTIPIDDTFNKRFRELQLNILDKTHKQINFYTDFKLDGREWMEATDYKVQHILEFNDPDYGDIHITPIDKENLHIYGTSVPTGEVNPNPFWSIDLSCFPNLAVATVRFTLQGKGRRASFQLLNTDLKQYELSDVTWVYRIMNAR